jgi:hypothetical protein
VLPPICRSSSICSPGACWAHGLGKLGNAPSVTDALSRYCGAASLHRCCAGAWARCDGIRGHADWRGANAGWCRCGVYHWRRRGAAWGGRRRVINPPIVLLFGADIKLAGSLSLAVSLPTMLVGFARYSQDRTLLSLPKTGALFWLWRLAPSSAASSVVGCSVSRRMPFSCLCLPSS